MDVDRTAGTVEDPAWAPKDEIAIRMDAHREERARKAEQESARRSRRRLTMALVLVAAAGLVYAGWYNRALFQRAAKPPPPPRASITAEEPADFIHYLLTRASAKLPDGRAYDLRRFEFDSNRFLSGNASLDNADKFRSTLAAESFRNELKDAWVIVFAGASFDGLPEKNRELCRERVLSVAATLRDTPGIAARGFWGVSAGEKVPEGGAISEKDENVIAGKMTEAERRKQRTLIIVAARPSGPAVADPPPDFIRQLAALLYEHKLLPADYDIGRGEPAPLNLPSRP